MLFLTPIPVALLFRGISPKSISTSVGLKYFSSDTILFPVFVSIAISFLPSPRHSKSIDNSLKGLDQQILLQYGLPLLTKHNPLAFLAEA